MLLDCYCKMLSVSKQSAESPFLTSVNGTHNCSLLGRKKGIVEKSSRHSSTMCNQNPCRHSFALRAQHQILADTQNCNVSRHSRLTKSNPMGVIAAVSTGWTRRQFLRGRKQKFSSRGRTTCVVHVLLKSGGTITLQ
jgi:hypothetical protein